MRGLVRLAIGLWLGGLSLITATRAEEWTDELTLWTGAVAHSPQRPLPWINLGQQYQYRGQPEKAALAFRMASRAAQAPARDRDEQIVGRAIADTNLALLAINRGDRAEGLRQLLLITTRSPELRTPQRLVKWVCAESPLPGC